MTGLGGRLGGEAVRDVRENRVVPTLPHKRAQRNKNNNNLNDTIFSLNKLLIQNKYGEKVIGFKLMLFIWIYLFAILYFARVRRIPL